MNSRFAIDARVGPYRLLQKLGRGGFGEVWLAEKDSTIAKSRFALKLPLDVDVDINAVRKEAELWMKSANHPNVLPIFEANIYDGQVAIASEYAADGSLEHWLTKHEGKAPSVETAADMAMGVLSGLEHLHVRGIVHRDLKPANILMQGEYPRIADFGLARLLDSMTTLHAAGTPVYMAPEAFLGERTQQTDLWSVGVILFEMLIGSEFSCLHIAAARPHGTAVLSAWLTSTPQISSCVMINVSSQLDTTQMTSRTRWHPLWPSSTHLS